MEIRISEKAKRQLKNIYNYYSENSIQYSEHFLEDFYNKIESLKEYQIEWSEASYIKEELIFYNF